MMPPYACDLCGTPVVPRREPCEAWVLILGTMKHRQQWLICCTDCTDLVCEVDLVLQEGMAAYWKGVAA